MSPMAVPPPATNPLDLNPDIVKTAYDCQNCAFTDYSAALAELHIEENQTHVIRVEWEHVQ